MKKMLFIIFFTLIAMNVFSLDIFSGSGISVGYYTYDKSDEYLSYDETDYYHSTRIPWSLSGFIDISYATAELGFSIASGGHSKIDVTIAGTTTPYSEGDFKDTFCYLDITLLGKYPIKIGPVSIFPLAGIECQINLLALDENGVNYKDGLSNDQMANFNRLWLAGGIGIDIKITDKLIIRAQGLYEYKLLSKLEQSYIYDMADVGNNTFITVTQIRSSLSVGYKL